MTAIPNIGSIKAYAESKVSAEELDKTLDSLATAWRRAGLQNFDRNRPLNADESAYVKMWFARRGGDPMPNAAPSTVTKTTPSVSSSNDDALRQQIATLKAEKIALRTETEARLAQQADDYKRLADEKNKHWQTELNREKERNANELKLKLAEQRATLTEAAGGKAEQKADAVRTQLDADIKRLNSTVAELKETQSALEKQAIEAKQQSEKSQADAVADEKKAAKIELKKVEADRDAFQKRIAELTADADWKDWRKWSEFDWINIGGALLAAASIIYRLPYVGWFFAPLVVLSYIGIIKTFKKRDTDWGAWLGFAGLAAIEGLVWLFHSTAFMGWFEGTKDLPFEMTYNTMGYICATAATAINVFSALMTRARAADAATQAENDRYFELQKQMAANQKPTSPNHSTT